MPKDIVRRLAEIEAPAHIQLFARELEALVDKYHERYPDDRHWFAWVGGAVICNPDDGDDDYEGRD